MNSALERLRALSAGRLEQLADALAILPDWDQWSRRAAALLATVNDPDDRADLREVFEHRAGVCEYDGCLPRDEAERIAFEELAAAFRALVKKKTDAST